MYIIIILLIILLIQPFSRWNAFKIWRWQRSLALKKHISIFNVVTNDIDGFALSRKARTRGDAFEYVYGEIDFKSFVALLTLTKPNQHTVFYDLGSGIGKAVFACSMVFQVKKSCGIELFYELHNAAKTIQSKLLNIGEYVDKAQQIYLVNENFIHANFEDATLIFINSTGYFGETWVALNNKLEKLSQCPIIITTTKPLSSKSYQVKQETYVQMSWGIVKAYIHEHCHR